VTGYATVLLVNDADQSTTYYLDARGFDAERYSVMKRRWRSARAGCWGHER
jgi:hypothetical protein